MDFVHRRYLGLSNIKTFNINIKIFDINHKILRQFVFIPQSGGDGGGGGPPEGGSARTEWRCVCYSADDWSRLADSYSGSRSPLELELYHTLKEDFLPEIPRLFAQKQKLQVGGRGCRQRV